MRVALAERFQRDVRALTATQRGAVFEVLLSLPRAIGAPHLHAGLGIRKLHGSGIWEARVGLGLGLVFALERDLLTLVRAGSHDEIRRFLKSL
jgi:mRNA-degrading endonuclease YafQ of YafQ-DinJ toxin-antitoxin module